jgi:hypothetical protein
MGLAHSALGRSPVYLEDQRLFVNLPPLARRAARVAIVALMAAAAVTAGLKVGQMGQGTRRVPSIAPTRQPVRQQAAERSDAPWPLPGTAGTAPAPR